MLTQKGELCGEVRFGGEGCVRKKINIKGGPPPRFRPTEGKRQNLQSHSKMGKGQGLSTSVLRVTIARHGVSENRHEESFSSTKQLKKKGEDIHRIGNEENSKDRDRDEFKRRRRKKKPNKDRWKEGSPRRGTTRKKNKSPSRIPEKGLGKGNKLRKRARGKPRNQKQPRGN